MIASLAEVRRDWRMAAPFMSMCGLARARGTCYGGAGNADVTAGHRVAASARLAAHVELENAGDHDHGLRPIPVLEHREFHRLGTVHEHAAAKTALILDDPVAAAVSADPEQGLGTRRRGRFAFIIHGTFPLALFFVIH